MSVAASEALESSGTTTTAGTYAYGSVKFEDLLTVVRGGHRADAHVPAVVPAAGGEDLPVGCLPLRPRRPRRSRSRARRRCRSPRTRRSQGSAPTAAGRPGRSRRGSHRWCRSPRAGRRRSCRSWRRRSRRPGSRHPFPSVGGVVLAARGGDEREYREEQGDPSEASLHVPPPWVDERAPSCASSGGLIGHRPVAGQRSQADAPASGSTGSHSKPMARQRPHRSVSAALEPSRSNR